MSFVRSRHAVRSSASRASWAIDMSVQPLMSSSRVSAFPIIIIIIIMIIIVINLFIASAT